MKPFAFNPFVIALLIAFPIVADKFRFAAWLLGSNVTTLWPFFLMPTAC